MHCSMTAAWKFLEIFSIHFAKNLFNFYATYIHTTGEGDGSGGAKVWNESPMMSWMNPFMTMEEEIVPMTKKFCYLCNQRHNGFFWKFSSMIRFGVSIYYVV